MQVPASLCPGYTHVESFGPEEEYESGEEVCYITLDLGDVEPQLLPSSNSYRLIGLDTPTPYLQLHGTILKGRHDMLLGTELIFTDDKDNHDYAKRPLMHVASTEQRVAFEEVTLVPKATSQGQTDAGAHIALTFDPPPAAETSNSKIETLTGLTAPTRAQRKRKDTKGKEKAAVKKGKGQRKGKGKEKADDDNDEDVHDDANAIAQAPIGMAQLAAEQGIGDDNLDDMYMDVDS